MTKAFPSEFRRDVVSVARQSDAPISQADRDFAISKSCLQRWLKLDDIEKGRRPKVTQAESVAVREANKRIRLLEQENETFWLATVYLRRGCEPKMTYPLVADLAGEGISITTSCRVHDRVSRLAQEPGIPAGLG